MVFLILVAGIYISTEIIVPKEFTNLNINNRGKVLEYKDWNTRETSYVVEGLSSINQFLLTKLDAVFKKGKEQEPVNVKVLYKVITDKGLERFNQKIELTIRHKKSGFLLQNHKRIYLPYIFNLSEKHLIFSLKILNAEDLIKNIDHFEVRVESNSSSFFYFFLVLKWMFFIISIISTFIFNKSFYEQLRQTRVTEQKLITVLGVMLIVYNFPLSFYVNETHPTVFFILATSFINIVFYSFIIYLWMVTFEVN